MAQIPDPLMGDIWPTALPGMEEADYGSATLSPLGSFEIRSFQSFVLVYTVGEYGLDDTGSIKIVQRWTQDGGGYQFDDPKAMNYVTATASNGVPLQLYQEPHPHQRPWYNGLRITVSGGYLQPGETIRVVLGDQSGGSPGLRLQTFAEENYEFRVLADPCATCVFLPVSSPSITIAPGSVSSWVLTAPTLRRIGEPFDLGIRAEDHWGNAAAASDEPLFLRASPPVEGLPDNIRPATGARGTRVEGLIAREEGTYRFELQDSDGQTLARSNPLIVREGLLAAYWGDLHGQSGETVGINPIRHYMEFARDVAFLDVTSHQANDFQVTNAFWEQINQLTVEMDDPGRFTVFPGYEWSANTPLGGDHNVFFRHEGEQIHRSSHALLEDRSDLDTDARTLDDLFAKLDGRDCVLYAHIGGRPADISRAENAGLRRSVELHSDWGTFEWILHDAFDLGYRVGVVCNSDGHKGAPGACYPGASEFGAYSGLTCFRASELSRDAIFDAMRRRRHYGTTGSRMHIDLTAHMAKGSVCFPEDPRISAVPPVAARTAQMGDIVRSGSDTVQLDFAVSTHSPIERVDVLVGKEVLETLRPYTESDLGNRVRVIWQGAEYRGRGRQTYWQGQLITDLAQIQRMEKFNAWNHERPIRLEDPNRVTFEAVTTGNFGGVDLWLSEARTGSLTIASNIASQTVDLSKIGFEDHVIDAGKLDRKMRLFRLPERMEATDFSGRVTVPVDTIQGDVPVWLRITTEDGHRAWTSPIYFIPE